MRSWFRLLTAAALTLVGTGCLDYEEVLSLNADGSGSVRIRFAMNKAFVNEMQAMARQYGAEDSESQTGLDGLCSEEEMRARLAAIGSKLKLVSYRSHETDSLLEYDLELKFERQSDLADLEAACEDGGEDGPAASWDFTLDKRPDGGWQYARYFQSGREDPQDAYAPREDAEEDESTATVDIDLQKMAEAMKSFGEALQSLASESALVDRQGRPVEMDRALADLSVGMRRVAEDAKNHKIRLVVNLPGTVTATNGTAKGKSAIWEYTLDQMASAPEVLTATAKP